VNVRNGFFRRTLPSRVLACLLHTARGSVGFNVVVCALSLCCEEINTQPSCCRWLPIGRWGCALAENPSVEFSQVIEGKLEDGIGVTR
jgi:hypothetical protein